MLFVPQPDFFNPDSDMTATMDFTDTHSHTENIIFLTKRKSIYELMRSEIIRLLMEDKFDTASPIISPLRKILLDHINTLYEPGQKEELRNYLNTLLIQYEQYRLDNLKNLIKLEKTSLKYNPEEDPKQDVQVIEPIDFLGSFKELKKEFNLLKQNSYVANVTDDILLMNFHCDDAESLENDGTHPFIWLRKDEDLAYTINGMAIRKKIHEYHKFDRFIPHVVKKNGEQFKDLSQKLYNNGLGLKDYCNESIDKILDAAFTKKVIPRSGKRKK